MLFNDSELRLFNCKENELHGIELFIRLFEMLEDENFIKKYAETLIEINLHFNE